MSELFEARSFALGMVALINPCGFALLPAYLGFFVSLEGDGVEERRIDSLNRAQLVGLSLTLGFLLVFGLIGIVFSGRFEVDLDVTTRVDDDSSLRGLVTDEIGRL